MTADHFDLRSRIADQKRADSLWTFASGLGAPFEWFQEPGTHCFRSPDAIVQSILRAARKQPLLAARLLGRVIELFGVDEPDCPAITKALALLTDLCRSRDKDKRLAALDALARCHSAVPLPAVHVVAERVGQESKCLQLQVLRTLYLFGVDKGALAVPAVVALLKSTLDAEVQLAACEWFATLGVDAKPAAGAIAALFERPARPEVLRAAAQVLVQMDLDDGMLSELVLNEVVAGRLDASLRELGEIGRPLRHKVSARQGEAELVAKSFRVKLFKKGADPEARIDGKNVRRLTQAQRNVIQALLRAGGGGLNLKALAKESGHSDARGILERLREANPDWSAVIEMSGRAGSGYRIH